MTSRIQPRNSTGLQSYKIQVSGVATGVARGGRVPPLTKICQKSGKKEEKSGKKEEKSGKTRKNREEMAKIRKFLSLCPPDR